MSARGFLVAGALLCVAVPQAQAAPALIEPDNSAVRAAQLPARPAQALTLDQQVGQVIVAGFDGRRQPAFVRSALRRDRLAGVILFAYNVGPAGQLRALTAAMRRDSRGSALVSVDQEGGQVRRIPYARPRAAQPAHASPGSVARQGARDLRALGLNVNFAPVADVPAGPGADIHPRAYRGSPATVGRKVAGAVRGYRAGRVAATVKHFPGLGAAPRNTDDAAVRITRSRAALQRTDLVPFRAAVAAGAPLVMASHAIYPAFDRTRLASQSPPILTGLLRRRMGYRGVVVTDALEARAVTQRMSVSRAAERSLLAGADLLLVTRPAGYGPVFRRLKARARASAAVRGRLAQSADRVLALKRSLGLRAPAGR